MDRVIMLKMLREIGCGKRVIIIVNTADGRTGQMGPMSLNQIDDFEDFAVFSCVKFGEKKFETLAVPYKCIIGIGVESSPRNMN